MLLWTSPGQQLKEEQVPGGPWLSDHVTLLALLQGRPVPLGVMALLGKWLCHIWNRKKAISGPGVITHSLSEALSGTAWIVDKDQFWGRVTGSWCCYAKGDPTGRRGTGLPCHSSTVIDFWTATKWWQVEINTHNPQTKMQRILYTSALAGKNGDILGFQRHIEQQDGTRGLWRSLLGQLASSLQWEMQGSSFAYLLQELWELNPKLSISSSLASTGGKKGYIQKAHGPTHTDESVVWPPLTLKETRGKGLNPRGVICVFGVMHLPGPAWHAGDVWHVLNGWMGSCLCIEFLYHSTFSFTSKQRPCIHLSLREVKVDFISVGSVNQSC